MRELSTYVVFWRRVLTRIFRIFLDPTSGRMGVIFLYTLTLALTTSRPANQACFSI